MTLAEAISRHLTDNGARAVVLAGSVVRGEAGDESDVDLYAFGPRSGYFLERQEGRLISVTWRRPEEESEAFLDPSKVGTLVPGWRGAIILRDPDGIAGDLQGQAQRWTWDVIGDEALGGHVAAGVTGLAEEVHKLVSALRDGRMWTAAVQRNVLALHLAPILAVHLRLLYETENRLWDLVAKGMGPEWQEGQRAAFEDPLLPSCRAALHLYGLAAEAVTPLLTPVQREVVRYAASLTP
jgi:hypothetical protein